MGCSMDTTIALDPEHSPKWLCGVLYGHHHCPGPGVKLFLLVVMELIFQTQGLLLEGLESSQIIQ